MKNFWPSVWQIDDDDTIVISGVVPPDDLMSPTPKEEVLIRIRPESIEFSEPMVPGEETQPEEVVPE